MSSTSSSASLTSSSTPFFTDSPSATPSQNSGGGGGFSSQSTPLYLFTFLATLFVLLFVSSAIVLRSFFLRRRYRRRLEEAIAAGIMLPPTTGPGSRHRDFGEKPKMWDANVKPSRDDQWEAITPVSVRISSFDSPPTPSAPSDSNGGNSRTRRIASLLHLGARRRASSSYTPSSPTTPNQQVDPTSAREDRLVHASEIQISLLVTMPNPHKPRYRDNSRERPRSVKGKERNSGYWDEEEGVPDVVVGVTHVPLTGGADT